jgi:hypothetical protein
MTQDRMLVGLRNVFVHNFDRVYMRRQGTVSIVSSELPATPLLAKLQPRPVRYLDQWASDSAGTCTKWRQVCASKSKQTKTRKLALPVVLGPRFARQKQSLHTCQHGPATYNDGPLQSVQPLRCMHEIRVVTIPTSHEDRVLPPP